MVNFGESSRLAAAYGLAVTGTMALTGILMTWIFYLKNKRLLAAISIFVTIVDAAYLTANLYKIPNGGFWSIILSMMPFIVIILYTQGQKRLYRMMDFMSLEDFLIKFTRVYESMPRIKGTALFLIKDINDIPFYVTQTMFFHGVVYV